MSWRTRRLIVLREHEALPIRDNLHAFELDALERINQSAGEKAFEIGRKEIRATQYVGTVQIGSVIIDVVPKIDDVDAREARARLVDMLAVAGWVPHVEIGCANQ